MELDAKVALAHSGVAVGVDDAGEGSVPARLRPLRLPLVYGTLPSGPEYAERCRGTSEFQKVGEVILIWGRDHGIMVVSLGPSIAGLIHAG